MAAILWAFAVAAGEAPRSVGTKDAPMEAREHHEAKGLPLEWGEIRGRRPLRLWWGAVHQAGAASDSFTVASEVQLRLVPWDGGLRTESMKKRAQFGILVVSPDSSLVLDPLVGHELVGPQGEVGADVDTGFSLFLSGSGARTYSWVSTLDHVAWAFWADSSVAMLGGWCLQEELGSSREVRPLVLMVSTSSGHMTKFVGGRVPEDFWALWGTLMRAVRERSFPQLQWSE